MAHITANELKTRGIGAIEALLGSGCTEAVVSVRGTDRYVVMFAAPARASRALGRRASGVDQAVPPDHDPPVDHRAGDRALGPWRS